MKAIYFIGVFVISFVVQLVLFLLLPIAHVIFFEHPDRAKASTEIVYEVETLVKKKVVQKQEKTIRKIQSPLKLQSPNTSHTRSFQMDLSLAATDASGEGVVVGGSGVANVAYEAGEVDQEARLLSAAEPKMPKRARREGVSGYVKVYMVIDEQGMPSSIQILRADPPGYGFEKAVMDVVRTYRFKPAMLNKVSVKQKVTKEFEFEAY